jgi:DNA-binding transcriptional ArsR family regulator
MATAVTTTPKARAKKVDGPAKATTPAPAKLNRADYFAAAITIKQFSDATRFFLLRLLGEQSRTVSELVDAIETSQPAISHHLALMRIGGLVTPSREGKFVRYSLTDRGRKLLGLMEAVVTA